MTAVKICGITGAGDARRSVELGAWALGMIFWPESARRCELEEAEAIGSELRRRGEWAAVFLAAPLDEVARLAELCRCRCSSSTATRGPRIAARPSAARAAK